MCQWVARDNIQQISRGEQHSPFRLHGAPTGELTVITITLPTCPVDRSNTQLYACG